MVGSRSMWPARRTSPMIAATVTRVRTTDQRGWISSVGEGSPLPVPPPEPPAPGSAGGWLGGGVVPPPPAPLDPEPAPFAELEPEPEEPPEPAEPPEPTEPPDPPEPLEPEGTLATEQLPLAAQSPDWSSVLALPKMDCRCEPIPVTRPTTTARNRPSRRAYSGSAAPRRLAVRACRAPEAGRDA
jgi:hypothetical protein